MLGLTVLTGTHLFRQELQFQYYYYYYFYYFIYLILVIVEVFSHLIYGSLSTRYAASSGLRMEEMPPIRRGAAKILSKQSMGGPTAGGFCGLLTMPTF